MTSKYVFYCDHFLSPHTRTVFCLPPTVVESCATGFNEKRLFSYCHRISHTQKTTGQFNLQFHQREQKSGESYQHAAPWKHNTSRSKRKAKVSRELHINANMLIWILSGYFLLRIHKGAVHFTNELTEIMPTVFF